MKLGITKTEYNRIHKWTERHLTKVGVCFYCSLTGKTHWSNIDHCYRQEPTEYQEVCPKCHANYDKTMGLVDYKNFGRPRTRPHDKYCYCVNCKLDRRVKEALDFIL